VLVLHGSPQSSRAVATAAEALAARGLCAIAPDTPGNGLSEPLRADDPDAGDYARALGALADALGLGRVGLYGFHTGAAAACAFASLFPQRTAAVVYEGLPCWTDAERADLLAHYLPPFAPAWDGSHMAWLWARLSEQVVFFPWHRAAPDARMELDVSSADHLHANALDFLHAGDGYRAPYRAAFTIAPEDWLRDVRAPSLLAATRTDVLASHYNRPALRLLPHQLFDEPAALREAAAGHLAAHPGDPAPERGGAADDSDGFVTVPGGLLGWRGRLHGQGRPLMLLHEAGGAGEDLVAVTARWSQARPVIALDLPGHGRSHEGWTAAPSSVAEVAEVVRAAMATLGLDAPDVAGKGVGAAAALELLRRGHAHRALVIGSSGGESGRSLPGSDLPALEPEWDGAHLLRAWRIARWERLFSPWDRRVRSHAVAGGDLDPGSVHRRACNLIRARGRWAAASWAEQAYDWEEALRQTNAKAIPGSPPGWPMDAEAIERIRRDP
jgi:pimeloyl-ACP methyl ester carboxylesterase